MGKEIDWGTIFEDDDSDYMIEDDEDFQMEAYSRRVAPQYLKMDELLRDIYYIHASMELGSFLYDWSLLPDDFRTEENMKWLRNSQTFEQYLKKYGVTYDGGKLMNDFLDFVKNNRNKDKCRMLFIYGSNDPWTGTAIPDPAPDDPYVKKYIVPGGVHGDTLNDPLKYSEAEKHWIVNTVKEMLAGS